MITVTPNRDLRLDGKPVPTGQPLPVPEHIAELWRANGWLAADKAAAAEPYKAAE